MENLTKILNKYPVRLVLPGITITLCLRHNMTTNVIQLYFSTQEAMEI